MRIKNEEEEEEEERKVFSIKHDLSTFEQKTLIDTRLCFGYVSISSNE